VLLPNISHADAGLPMLFVFAPILGFSIVPIIFIEGFYLAKFLEKPRFRMLKYCGGANLISTVLGVPITWLILFGLQLVISGGSGPNVSGLGGEILSVTWQAPWLMPDKNQVYWMNPAASAFLIVFFFLASWLIESFIINKLLGVVEQSEKKFVNKAVRNANLITYGFLAIVITVRVQVW
jgi:hypothetical protein